MGEKHCQPAFQLPRLDSPHIFELLGEVVEIEVLHRPMAPCASLADCSTVEIGVVKIASVTGDRL
jgi:hypothetical protein